VHAKVRLHRQLALFLIKIKRKTTTTFADLKSKEKKDRVKVRVLVKGVGGVGGLGMCREEWSADCLLSSEQAGRVVVVAPCGSRWTRSGGSSCPTPASAQSPA
jgi:hypothetical protein